MTPGHRRITADLLADVRTTLGEGPVWDAANDRVLWVDILEGHINATQLDGSSETIASVEPPIGALALRASGGLVLVSGNGVQTCGDDGSDLTELVHVEMRSGERWNDAKVDPAGRLIAGTLTTAYPDGVTKTYPPLASRLLRIDPDRSVQQLMDVTLSNGLGWTADGRTFFYVDTRAYRLDAYDYEPATGERSGQRQLVAITDGSPDGLAVDVEGGVWLAIWGGSCVRRYLPDGSLDAEITLPVTAVTSCAFVGPDLDRLFITSAIDDLTPEQKAAQTHAGSVFLADPGVRGVPVAAFAG